MWKKAAIVLAVAATFTTAGYAYMWSGGQYNRGDHHRGSGWYCGMSHSGYCCDYYMWQTSAGGYSTKLLAQGAAQKLVEDLASKSFPGYRVGKAEKESYRGRPIYTVSLTGNDSRFEVQLDAVDGRVIGIYPIEE